MLSSCTKDNTQSEKEDDEKNSNNIELITIHLPDNIVNQYIINAVVFASRMDGSLLASKRFNSSDKTVILYTDEEIALDVEYMVTFALTDNGIGTNLLTYANLTREKLSSVNLKTPVRLTEGTENNYGAVNFQPTDNVATGTGIKSFDRPVLFFLNQNKEDFKIIVNEGLVDPMESIYLFGQPNIGFNEYSYMLLNLPLDDNFILDKNEFITDGVDSKYFNVSKSNNMNGDQSASLQLYGYLNDNDKANHRYHNMSFTGAYTQSENEYNINSIFSDYWYSINNGEYYAERQGLPMDNYVIPELAIDHTLVDKTINVNITGTEHEVGRIQLMNYENQNMTVYVWNFSFDSKTTSSITIPELPKEMAPSMLQGYYDNSTFKVGSVEVYNYFGLNDYEDYLNELVKDQKHLFEGSDGFEMISHSDFQYYNSPIRDYVFQ